jgi:outer membrane biosynthesis protein TonB
MKTLSFVFIVVFLFVVLPSEGSVGQTRRHRHRPRHSVTSSSENRISSASGEEADRIAEQCSLPNRAKPEVEVKGNAMLCGKAISLPKPPYHPEAKAAKASGSVTVQVVIDEEGRMIWAKAIDGHPLLQEVSVKAACRARAMPVKISGRAVKADGAISYNFVAQ